MFAHQANILLTTCALTITVTQLNQPRSFREFLFFLLGLRGYFLLVSGRTVPGSGCNSHPPGLHCNNMYVSYSYVENLRRIKIVSLKSYDILTLLSYFITMSDLILTQVTYYGQIAF